MMNNMPGVFINHLFRQLSTISYYIIFFALPLVKIGFFNSLSIINIPKIIIQSKNEKKIPPDF